MTVEEGLRKRTFCVTHIYRGGKPGKQEGLPLSLPGSFAVKEAVAKVFGTGFRTFMPGDIEVLRDELGKPYVRLYGGALEQFEKMGMEQIHVSISNTNGLAMAFAVGEGRGEQKK